MNILKKNRFKIICGSVLLAGGLVLTAMNLLVGKGVKITEWNNFYNENNIAFFYEQIPNEKLATLDSAYKISEQASECKTDYDKVMKAVEIVNKILKADDVESTNLNDGYDILSRKTQSNRSSIKDMAVVTRDFINILGIKNRIGVFRKGNSKYHSDVEYYVIEYWSSEDNKWVMIDVSDGGHFEDDNTKLSAVEVINSDVKKIPYLGETSQLDYKNKISKYFDSYSVSIENSCEKKRSNCNVTYIKNDTAIEYKIKDTFAAPTVFTKERKLFERSPFDTLVGSDEKAYLLVCGAISNDDEKKDAANNKKKTSSNESSILVAAFKDDSVLKEFYLNVNGEGYEQVQENKEVKLKKGSNVLELSLDGINTVGSVTIEKQ